MSETRDARSALNTVQAAGAVRCGVGRRSAVSCGGICGDMHSTQTQ
ncbi:MAG: hypothetical protein J6Z26_00805 [Bacteroidales bacterium]|nr:hypothetical protein [Bacteroidales bacterium]MBP5758537.1 hypothetical protein [Bacteroidales bacterium]